MIIKTDEEELITVSKLWDEAMVNNNASEIDRKSVV